MADLEHVERCYHGARALEGAALEEYLVRMCRDDEELLTEVRALLAADEEAGAFLEPSAPDAPPAAARDLRPTPINVGPYRLLERIGEGGFGDVYMAQQNTPVKRRVALKIVKLGMDTRQVVERFEQERQALAILDHPNIAKVFDAGETAQGRPYFVMELVDGTSITEYCDEHRLSIPERLALFVQVCRAVQHAHTKGIIHRDIKPTNVLVETRDGRPHAKVIDFGIAKAVDVRLTHRTLFTEHRQLIGTLEYMSPEQAEGSLDIDTRTDVYSLGVLLYELLTGSPPFDPKELRSAAHAEMQRIIQEVDPPPPSRQLSESTATLGIVAAMRRTAPGRLGHLVRGELDWIVLRALDKDRGRRYPTPNGLAQDVEHYLAGEAVDAAPPGRTYRARKFVRRHRAGVTAAALIGVALLLGMITTAWQAGVARDDRDAAQAARASEARQREVAEGERDRATAIADFLTRTLSAIQSGVAEGHDITIVRAMMDDAAERIESGRLDATPGVELALRRTIGGAYLRLALYHEARTMFEPTVALARALHPEGAHADIYASLTDLGRLAVKEGDQPLAERLFRESLEVRRAAHPGGDLDVATGMMHLANLLEARGDEAGANRLRREVAAEFRAAVADLRTSGRAESPAAAAHLNAAANQLRAAGDLDLAATLLRDALAIRRRLAPSGDAATAATLGNLAYLEQMRGEPEEAKEHYTEALEITRRLHPGDHPAVARSLSFLSLALAGVGEREEARTTAREALDMHRRLHDGDHPIVANALWSLSRLEAAGDDLDAAETHLRESIEMMRRLQRDDSPEVAARELNLADLLARMDRLEEAISRARGALTTQRRRFPEAHPRLLPLLQSLSDLLRRVERHAEAAALTREALDICIESHGPDARRTAEARIEHGRDLVTLARWTDAERELKEAHRTIVATLDETPAGRRVRRDSVSRLVELYERWEQVGPDEERSSQAARWREELEKLRE